MTTAPRPARAGRAGAGPQSVGRIFAILDAVVQTRSGVALAELARLTASPKTSLVGLLAGMIAEGCLVRDEAGRYRLGPRVQLLAVRTMAGRELSELLRPILAALVEATGETAVLGTIAPDAALALYVDVVESANAIRYAVKVGERRELYCTAMGKVLLAHFDADRLKRYLREVPRQRFTGSTITGARELAAELARIRETGLARSDGERVAGATALAAPVFGPDGTVAAALLIAGPSERMRARSRDNERLLRDAAAACTRLAGGTPPALGSRA